MDSTTRSRCPAQPGEPGERAAGVFVAQHVIIAAASLTVGVVAGVLVWLAPGVGLPVGAGVAVTGLSLELRGLWRDRLRP